MPKDSFLEKFALKNYVDDTDCQLLLLRKNILYLRYFVLKKIYLFKGLTFMIQMYLKHPQVGQCTRYCYLSLGVASGSDTNQEISGDGHFSIDTI